MCNLKITSPLCLLPTGAGLLKSLSPEQERERESKCCRGPNKKKREKGQEKEGGTEMENGAQVGGQRQSTSKKGKEGRVLGKMWDR